MKYIKYLRISLHINIPDNPVYLHCYVGVDKRRDHVSELQQEEETFQEDLVEVSRLISELENLTTQEITDVSVEKCEQLASTYQVGIFGSGLALVFIRILENLVFKCEEMLNY